MKPKWVIEDFEPDNKFGELAEEVKRQGMECEVIRYTPFQSGSYDIFEDTDCVLFQGSINLAQQLLREKKWIPNAWLTAKNYECTTYFAHFGKYLLNDHYIILPRAEATRQMDRIFHEYLGKYEAVFCRPNSGLKPFTAGVFHTLNIKSFWDWVEEFTEPDALIVFSTPKEILCEWRFICANKEIITGCQYEKDKGLSFSHGYPEEAKAFAQEIASNKFQPDPMYTIDVCLNADKEYKLLEINSFSCAGLYACDMGVIVERASEIALKEWEDHYIPIK